MGEKYIDIVFDAPPGPEPSVFIEVEDDTGKSIKFGEWVEQAEGGYWALRIPDLRQEVERLREENMQLLRYSPSAELIEEVERLRGLCDNLTDSLNGCNENNQAFSKRFREDQARLDRLVGRLETEWPLLNDIATDANLLGVRKLRDQIHTSVDALRSAIAEAREGGNGKD